MSIRTIHVGVGGRGAWPIQIMGADERFVPVAFVDTNVDFLATARNKFHDLRPDERLSGHSLFTDLAAALAEVEADAVVICTPTRTHAALAGLAFAAGKHVLVEKGMSMNFAEAKSMVDAAERADVKFCVAQNYRYQDNELTVKALLDDATHAHHPGKIQIVDYIHHRYRPEPKTLNYPFAMVWDMTCHHADSLANWLGPAMRVTAHSYNAPWSQYQHDSNIAAIIEYESGAVCHYVLTHSATMTDHRVILQGERGALRTYDVDGVEFYPKPTEVLGQSKPIPCELIQTTRSTQRVADAFHDYISKNEEPGISGRNNLDTLAVCEMLVRSAMEKRAIMRGEL